MSDAPERIWAWPEPDDGLSDQVDEWGWVYGDWDRSRPEDGLGVEYIRADLHTAALARAERAEALLAEAVEALRQGDTAMEEAEAILGGEYDIHHQFLCDSIMLFRATLAKLKENGHE